MNEQEKAELERACDCEAGQLSDLQYDMFNRLKKALCRNEVTNFPPLGYAIVALLTDPQVPPKPAKSPLKGKPGADPKPKADTLPTKQTADV